MSPVSFASKSGGHVPPSAPMGAPPITGTKSDDGCAINYRYGALQNLSDCIIFMQQNALTQPRCKNVEFPCYYSRGIRQWYQKFAVRIANGIYSWCAHVVRNTGTDIQTMHLRSSMPTAGRSGLADRENGKFPSGPLQLHVCIWTYAYYLPLQLRYKFCINH